MKSPRLVKNLKYAVFCAPRALPAPSTTWARAGLRYERNVARALEFFTPIWHNPWYYFEDDNGPGYICPDVIIPARMIIIECKLTYKAEAIKKLKNLYCPVVTLATSKPTLPLVVVKNLNEHAPNPELSILDALKLSEPLLHWPGKGSIDWGIARPVGQFPKLLQAHPCYPLTNSALLD